MERNVDRNLRVAKQEARRFFGIRRRRPIEVVVFGSLFLALAGYVMIEPHLKDHRFFHDGLLTLGLLLLSVLIFWLVARLFGVDLWGPQRGKRRRY